MKDKIKQLLSDIQEKKELLKEEYSKRAQKYKFQIINSKVIWDKDKFMELKRYKESIYKTLFGRGVREFVSIPFIYIMILPAIILDIFLFIYQQTALRLYKIPRVKRSDYIVFDRKKLPYLNWLQKLNCMYCSYFNGLMQYAVEIAGRTEKYWCPIKHVKKKYGEHNWEIYFADYGDVDGFKKTFCSIKEFEENKIEK